MTKQYFRCENEEECYSLWNAFNYLLKSGETFKNITKQYGIFLKSSFSETFKKFVMSLPAGQTVELWKNILNKIKTSITSSQYDEVLHFICLQFVNFLLHIKLDDSIPLHIMPEVDRLMNETKVHISGTLQLSRDKCFDPHLQSMTLMYSYAWGEVHLMLKIMKKIYCTELEWPEIDEPLLTTDLSVLHSYLSKRDWNNILNKMLQAEKKLIYPVVLLYLQKIRALNACSCSNNSILKSIKVVASEVISILLNVEWNSVTATWNRELETITSENYPVALWSSVLVHSPLFISYLSQKDLLNLSVAMTEIVMESESYSSEGGEANLQLVIKEFLKGSLFPEMKSLQTAFISSLMKYAGTRLIHSKKRSLPGSVPSSHEVCIFEKLSSHNKVWSSMAETLPKQVKIAGEGGTTNKKGVELNDMWELVKSASEIFNEWLKCNCSSKKKLNTEKAIQLIKVLNYLPLEFLLPGNQVRCILGSSVLLMFVDQVLDNNRNSAFYLFEELSKIMISIFEGVRSVWFFDFVKISSFLRNTVRITGRIMSLNNEEGSMKSMTFVIHKLLNNIVAYAVKHKESLQSVDSFIIEINYALSDHKICFQNEALILSTVLFLQKLVSILQQAYIQEKYRNVCHEYAYKLCSSLTEMINSGLCKPHSGDIKRNTKTLIFNSAAVILDYAYKVKSEHKYNKLDHRWLAPHKDIAEMAFETLRNESEISLINSAMGVIERICSVRESISTQICTKDFFMNAWSSVQQHLNNKANEILKLTGLFLSFSSIHHKSDNLVGTVEESDNKKPQLINYRDFEAVLSRNTVYEDSKSCADNMSSVIYSPNHYHSEALNKEELNILSTLMKFCTAEEFQYCVEELLKPICKQEIQNASQKPIWMKLHTLSVIIDAQCNRLQRHQQSELLQKVFTSLHHFENRAISTPSHILNELIPILHFISTILKKEKTFLPHHEIIRCLRFCGAVPFTQFLQYPAVYRTAFEAVYNSLNEMLLHHLHAVLSAGPPFIACVSVLLKSLISASNQDFVSTYDASIQNKLQLCAQNTNRLLTQLSEQKKEFSKVAPYIIADYVDEVQHITIHPCIKPYLISGLYRIMDICTDHAVSMLCVTLNPGSKEIFKVLYTNYSKNYRYQGKV